MPTALPTNYNKLDEPFSLDCDALADFELSQVVQGVIKFVVQAFDGIARRLAGLSMIRSL